MAEREHVVVQTEYEVNTRKFDAGIKKTAALQKKHLKETTKLTEKLDKATRAISTDITSYGQAAQKALSKAEKLQEDLLNATGDTRHELEDSIEAWKDYQRIMEEMKSASEDLRKESRNRLMMEKKELKQAEELLAVRRGMARLEEKKKSRHIERIEGLAEYGGKEMGDEFGDSIKDALSSLSSKDFGGLAKGLFGALGSIGKGAAGGIMRGGAAAGGAGPMGAMAKALGPILNIVSKIGPIVMTLSTLIMAVVKILLDAEAAAKDFNKEILQSAGTAGFLAKNMGDAGVAAMDLEEVMHDMYDQAASLDNLSWGISKETHQQIEQAIFAQGVMIDKVAEYFDDVKAGRKENQGMVKDWGTMVQMSVGYSRAFGVSMTEVADLQGEMMSELGMGFDDVQAGFQAMVEGAVEAGVGTNKFFNQMRAISSDLSLFNLRIGDAAKLMTQLDKAMSPRKAQEFFQTITKFFKGMGLMDRAKMVLMAGTGKTKGILKKDLDSKVNALSQDLDKLGKGMGDEFKQALGKKGQLVKFMAKHDKELNGETRDAIMSAGRQSDKITRGGIINLASALKDASPFAAMDEIEAMSKNMFGKPLEDLSDIELAAVDQAAGINDEQLDQFAKLKQSLDVQKETIAQKLENGDKLTDDEIAMLGKMHVGFTAGARDKEAADKLRAKDSKDVWDNMSKSQQDLLRDSAGTLDQAKRQGDLTQSVLDKLGVLLDFIMKEIYDVMSAIYESFLDLLNFLHVGDVEGRKLKKAQVEANKSKDAEVREASANAKNTGELVRNLKGTSIGKNLQTVIGPDADARKKALLDEIGKQGAAMKDMTKTEEERKAAEDAWRKADSNYQTLSQMQFKANQKVFLAMQNAAEADRGALQGYAGSMSDQFEKAFKKMATSPQGWPTGTDSDQVEKQMKKGMKALEDGKTLTAAMEESGLSKEQQQIFYQNIVDTLDPKSYAKLIADYGSDYKGLVAKNAAVQGTGGGGGGSPSGQQAASDKAQPAPPPQAAAPGGGGASTPAPAPSAAQAAAVPSSQKPVTPKDIEKSSDQQGQNIQDSMDDLRLNMKKQSSGIVLNGPYLKNQYGGQIEDSMYNAASRALFEYYMYSDLEREDVASALRKGLNPRDFGAAMVEQLRKGGEGSGAADKRAEIAKALKPNALGGDVVGPMPGNEMLALVKRGERIVPAGGGGDGTLKVIIGFADGAERVLKATAHNAIQEDKRRGRLA